MASLKATISPRGALDRGVLGRHLAAARQVEDEVGAGVAGELDGPVGGAVGGDDQLEPLARVVERERVGDLGRDHVLLVEGGDDQRDARRLGAADGGPAGAGRRRSRSRSSAASASG